MVATPRTVPTATTLADLEWRWLPSFAQRAAKAWLTRLGTTTHPILK